MTMTEPMAAEALTELHDLVQRWQDEAAVEVEQSYGDPRALGAADAYERVLTWLDRAAGRESIREDDPFAWPTEGAF